MAEADTITIAILAGGGSRRMGRDKASIAVEGETWLERTVRIASGCGTKTIVVGRAMPDSWSHHDARFVADERPGLGPLGGLATALRHAGGPVALLPCDMPFLTTDAVAWLVDAAAGSSGTHGLIVRNEDRVEPLFSAYFVPALQLADRLLARSSYAMRDFIAAGDFAFAALPGEHARALRNVNRPEEFDARP